MFSNYSDLIIQGLGLESLMGLAGGGNAGQWAALLIFAWFLLISTMVKLYN